MLAPAIDNSIFSESTNSAGADAGLFAGATNNGDSRRALLDFNFASAGIPSGATITDVSLELSVSQGNGDHPFSLHTLTGGWGEGTSVGTGTGGGDGDGWWHRRRADSWRCYLATRLI